MVDFEQFDKQVNTEELAKEVENTPEYSEIKKGTYILGLDKMELKLTKAGDKVMFSVQCNIKEGKEKGRKLFFNRTLSGSTSEKWTDGMAIKSVVTWVNELIGEDGTPIRFINYSDFAEQILDAFQELQNSVEVEIEYKANDFNPITIKEVFDI